MRSISSGAALHEHLDGDVVGDEVLFDELADEVEVGLAGRREPDLDLLEAHRDERLEHAQLAVRVHRVDERLVAVAEVDRAPQRRLLDLPARPRAIGERRGSGRNGRYFSNGIGLAVDGLGRHRSFLFGTVTENQNPLRRRGSERAAYVALAVT